MLLDDAEYMAAMQDICDTECSVDVLRRQFARMLICCRPANGLAIYEMFKSELCGCENPQPSDEQCTLWALADCCRDMGRSLDEFGFALPDTAMLTSFPDDNEEHYRIICNVAYAKFSHEQRAAAEVISQAVADGKGGVHFIQASGGCGKSFWANGVSASLRVAGHTPVVVAASGLAANLLDGGRTAHSALGIPLELHESSWCSCDQSSKVAIINSPVIFWDECSMVHVDAANCVNRSMQDWTQNSQLFGGKVVIFMGDFQQLLPVVRGGCGDAATLMTADWWKDVQILQFTRNYRSDNADYCAMLKNVGSGAWTQVEVPHISTTTDLDEMCRHVLGDSTAEGCHIVTLTLEDAAKINSMIIAQLPGTLVAAAAADTKIHCKDPDLYSDEFLHSLVIPGAPPAVLDLKIGAR
jgi:hypothetical protein